MPRIAKALISVSFKEGIVPFAKKLSAMGIEILSTGGTARLLRENGIPVVEVSDFTGQPEILDGRVKTLHPKIHGGILAIRGNKKHQQELKQSGIQPIDMVVVNLYPFEETIQKRDVLLQEAIENIDIGGPAMLRSAAKNWQDVTVICDPVDYDPVWEELKKNGAVSKETNFRLAKKVFTLTAKYDASISNYLSGLAGEMFAESHTFQCKKIRDLRYGENPHQKAAWYQLAGEPIQIGEPLQGKEISYNNLLDIDAAIGCARDLGAPFAAVIVKHGNPCGVGLSHALLKEAFLRAREGDPVSAFGGIVAACRELDEETAKLIAETFFEVVCAPGFSKEAREVLSAKKNLRLLCFDSKIPKKWDLRTICGGMLVQTADQIQEKESDWKIVTRRKPSKEESEALSFAWKVVKHVKSNAIVIADSHHTLGIGAGQMSRIDSVRIAIGKMSSPSQPLILASDAFFPFRDSVDEAAKAGITAIIQPGGSLKDQESIDAANGHNIAMVFTGVRHFRH